MTSAITFFLAATIWAVSPSRDHVSDAVNEASTGDTVMIPAGTAYWVSALTISGKGIHIRGAGTNESTGTVLVDENPSRASSVTMFNVTWNGTSGMFRLSHLMIKGGTTNTGVSSGGSIQIYGLNVLTNSQNFWRLDHLFFNNPRTRAIYALAWNGLIDQCSFHRHEVPGGPSAGCVIDGRTPNSLSKGHESYAVPVYWGSSNFVFLERNYETKSAARGFTDGFAGARYVVRYNQTTNGFAGNHGTESTGISRGTRAMEVYGNVLHQTSGSQCASEWRSGTGVVFSNTISGYPGMVRGVAYRLVDDDYAPWGPANGTNVWDLNATNSPPGDPWETGTHTGSNGSASLVDNTKSWTPGQWFGYTVQQESPLKWGLILTNTATAMSFESPVISTNVPTWNTGDAYKIWRVWQALDQPGTGLSDLLTGGGSGSPPSQATPTTWPNQAAEPIYIWDNTGSNSDTVFRYGTMRQDEHFKFEAMPDYTPYTYPHPVADYLDGLEGGGGGGSFTTVRNTGRSTISGRATIR